MHRENKDQGIIQIYNNTKLLHWQGNKIGLVNEMKILVTVATPNGKPFTENVYFANNIQMLMMLNNRDMQISIIKINRKE